MLPLRNKIASLILALGIAVSSAAQDTRMVEWYIMESTNFSAKGIPAVTSQLLYNLNNRFAVGIDYYASVGNNKDIKSQIWDDNTGSYNGNTVTSTTGTVKRGVKQYGIVARANLLRSNFFDLSLSYLLNYSQITNSANLSGSTTLSPGQQAYIGQQYHNSKGLVNGLSLGVDFNFSRSVALAVRITDYDILGNFHNKASITTINEIDMQDGYITSIKGIKNSYFPLDISAGINFRFGYKKL